MTNNFSNHFNVIVFEAAEEQFLDCGNLTWRHFSLLFNYEYLLLLLTLNHH